MILRMTKIVKKQHVGTFIQWRIKVMPASPPPPRPRRQYTGFNLSLTMPPLLTLTLTLLT